MTSLPNPEIFEDPEGLAQLRQAVLEAERSRKHASLLAKISSRLSSSLENEVNLARIGELMVPLLGDWCLIDIVNEDGILKREYVAHTDPDAASLAKFIALQVHDSFESGLRESVLISKSPIMMTDIQRFIPHEESPNKIRINSIMLVPIKIYERIMGVLTCIITHPNRNYNDLDLKLAEEVAYRAAIAMDNSWLYSQAKAAVTTRDHFFAMVSHELKTPLTALTLQNQFMLNSIVGKKPEEIPLDKVEVMLKSALHNIKQLNNMIGEFLDIASINSGRLSVSPQNCDLSKLVLETVDRFSTHLLNVSCTVRTELCSPCFVSCDWKRIEQVLDNLLNNAIKYAPKKPIVISLKELESIVELRIQDSGPGISKEDQLRIFKRYSRSKSVIGKVDGLGLGLYIVKEIIRAHSGSIHVESNLGQGTTFVIRLPKRKE